MPPTCSSSNPGLVSVTIKRLLLLQPICAHPTCYTLGLLFLKLLFYMCVFDCPYARAIASFAPLVHRKQDSLHKGTKLVLGIYG